MKSILNFVSGLEMNSPVGNETGHGNEPEMKNSLEMNSKNELEMNRRNEPEMNAGNEQPKKS